MWIIIIRKIIKIKNVDNNKKNVEVVIFPGVDHEGRQTCRLRKTSLILTHCTICLLLLHFWDKGYTPAGLLSNHLDVLISCFNLLDKCCYNF